MCAKEFGNSSTQVSKTACRNTLFYFILFIYLFVCFIAQIQKHIRCLPTIEANGDLFFTVGTVQDDYYLSTLH